MFGPSSLLHVFSILALLGPAVATTVWRVTDKQPKDLKATDGFKAPNPKGKGSVLDHVDGRHRLGANDPWISTSASYDFATAGAKSGLVQYLYHIDISGLEQVDTIKAFRDAKKDHPHPAEKEISVKGHIPWLRIVKWETYKRGKKEGTTERRNWEEDPSRSPTPEPPSPGGSPSRARSNSGSSSSSSSKKGRRSASKIKRSARSGRRAAHSSAL